MDSAHVRITLIVDNQAHAPFTPEHGLAMWIEAHGRRMLFDTGQGGALAKNAELLGIDPAAADTLVLSHGHYDHTGGISHVLGVEGNTEVYFHPDAVLPRWSIRDGKPRQIGMPTESLSALEQTPGDKLKEIRQPQMLSPFIGITGFVPRRTNFEDTGGPFYLDPAGVSQDPVNDDLALWIKTGKGLVVCIGCCHSGLVNTLTHIENLNNGARIHAIIGGFHLLAASERRLDSTLEVLKRVDPHLLIPCHCTGEKAVEMFRHVLGDTVIPGEAGRSFIF